MTDGALAALVALGSGPLAGGDGEPGRTPPTALAPLFARCDGFYAFGTALHVFPSTSRGDELGLWAWNAADLWRQAFPSVPADCCFFAEDVFGGQFALLDGVVSSFNPETGRFDPIAGDLDGWAAAVLADAPVLTGHPLAHDWELANGALRPGRRLLPKVPFVLGGDFAVDNLYDADAVAGMRYRGDLATQIRDLPDGSTIRLRIVE